MRGKQLASCWPLATPPDPGLAPCSRALMKLIATPNQTVALQPWKKLVSPHFNLRWEKRCGGLCSPRQLAAQCSSLRAWS